MFDEDTHNSQWLEAAYENFQQAKEDGNVPLAKLIIADTFDAGFAIEARSMSRELRNVKAK